MKILKEGIWNLPWTTEVSCPTCKALLLVEEADVKPAYDSWECYCHCEVCKKQIPLDRNGIPPRVLEAVDKKRKWHACSD